MQKITKKIIGASLLIGGILLSSASTATTLVYPLSKDSTEQNPQAFYCTATKIEQTYPGDIVLMSNFIQQIKGFGPDGNRIIGDAKLNEVYFLAYHDKSLPYQESGYITLTGGTFDFKCYPGTGGRKLIEGPFG